MEYLVVPNNLICARTSGQMKFILAVHSDNFITPQPPDTTETAQPVITHLGKYPQLWKINSKMSYTVWRILRFLPKWMSPPAGWQRFCNDQKVRSTTDLHRHMSPKSSFEERNIIKANIGRLDDRTRLSSSILNGRFDRRILTFILDEELSLLTLWTRICPLSIQ